jgi:hypothetical protein
VPNNVTGVQTCALPILGASGMGKFLELGSKGSVLAHYLAFIYWIPSYQEPAEYERYAMDSFFDTWFFSVNNHGVYQHVFRRVAFV